MKQWVAHRKSECEFVPGEGDGYVYTLDVVRRVMVCADFDGGLR